MRLRLRTGVMAWSKGWSQERRQRIVGLENPLWARPVA